MMRRNLVLLVIGTVGLMVLACWWAVFSSIPKDSLTITRMHVLKTRVHLYLLKEKRLPQSLGELPQLEGYDCSLVDGWGRPFEFSVVSNSAVRIVSLGQDGLKSRDGSVPDIEGVFVLNPGLMNVTNGPPPWALDPAEAIKADRF